VNRERGVTQFPAHCSLSPAQPAAALGLHTAAPEARGRERRTVNGEQELRPWGMDPFPILRSLFSVLCSLFSVVRSLSAARPHRHRQRALGLAHPTLAASGVSAG
jgi:hypothetical protein